MDPKENLIRAITRKGPEYVPYPGGPGRNPVQGFCFAGGHSTHWRRGRLRWVDELWGVEHAVSDENAARDEAAIVVASPIHDLADLDAYPFPNPRVPERFAEIRATIDAVHRLPMGSHRACLFSRACWLNGMEAFLMEMAARPALAKDLLHRIATFHVEIAKQYVEAGVQMGGISDDWGTQRALMMSPAAWREFIKPELARIVAVYKDAGCLVNVHSCGHIQEVVGDLIEIGVDVWNPVQARANDLAWLKTTYGERICFEGAVDSHEIMMLGSPEDVERETARVIRLMGPGGGFIVRPDQGMPFPEANVAAFRAAAERYGRYPLAG